MTWVWGTVDLVWCVITVMDACVHPGCHLVDVQATKHCSLIQKPHPVFLGIRFSMNLPAVLIRLFIYLFGKQDQ